MAAFPSTGVYRRLHNLRPNLDVVLRFAVDAFSMHRIALAGREPGKDVGQ